MRWVYGVTTVPERSDDLLPQTLKSLANAGFDKPRLFVDGASDSSDFDQFGLEVTTRYPNVRTFGNWVLSLWELYLRDPAADRYAIFQDDFVTYTHLREYLEGCEYPEDGYWNLYTFPSNEAIIKRDVRQQRRPERFVGWYRSNQRGLGAVALIFSRLAVTTLLSTDHMVLRPQDAKRGWRAVDGGIVEAFKKEGWKEYVHYPSLVQHTGKRSAMGNKEHKQSASFRGEKTDARSLIPESGKIRTSRRTPDPPKDPDKTYMIDDKLYDSLTAHGWLTREEAELLWEVATEMTKGPILEVGSYYGRSTVLLAATGRLVYAVDPFSDFNTDDPRGDKIEAGLKLNLKNADANNVQVFRTRIENWGQRPIGFAYLDGDHSLPGTKKQIEVAKNCGAKIICVHDYDKKGDGKVIKRAIREMHYTVVRVAGTMAYCINHRMDD